MGDLTPLDVQLAITEIARHLPGVVVRAVRGLGSEWAIDPTSHTVFVENGTPAAVAARAIAGLDALTAHFGLPRPRRLHLAPPPGDE